MKTHLLIALLLLGSFLSGKAQLTRCLADQHQAALEANDPSLAAARLAQENAILQLLENNPEYRSAGAVTIPVVFHIIYNGAAQNIPDNRIYDQLDVLNDDYARLNANAINTRSMFLSVAANTQVQFCLAQQTPTGAATNGIIRTSTNLNTLPNNPNSISPEWDHTRYLNVYVGNIGPLGYANFPPGSAGNDHVVVLYSTVGGQFFPGTYQPYHLGRTLTHEVGHWLNLHHTFNSGCGGTTNNTCLTAGDRVCDTPPVASSVWGCPGNTPNTCTETSPFPSPYVADMVDMYENYMDYTDDDCMNIFTIGQGTRMNAAISTSRSQLLTSTGCTPVGLNEFPDKNLVNLAPNPSLDGRFVIHTSFPAGQKIDVDIYDLNGRMVTRQHNMEAVNGTIEMEMEPAAGVYQVKVSTQAGFLFKKLVIAGNK